MGSGGESFSAERVSRAGAAGSTPIGWPDAVLTAALALLAVGYLGSLPNNVRAAPDEAHVLHQAKRLLDGEVLYRDLFDLAMPLWTYLMAGMFAVFGTTLATARLTVAVVHGAALALLYLLCRRLAVRREIAALAAFAYLVICQPVYPVANRHWLVTLVGLGLLYLCVGARADRRVSLGGGILAGVLISIHQQRGVGMAVAFATWMVLSSLMARRCREQSEIPLPAAAARFATGVLAVVAPMLVLVSWRAGVGAVWYALIVHPLTHYLGTLQATWGGGGHHVAAKTLPVLLKALPLALVPLGLRLAMALRRRDLAEARLLLAPLIFCAFAAASILYYPDLAHLAFVAPFSFVVLAALGEWGLSRLPAGAAALAARLALLLFVLAGGARLIEEWRFEHRAFRFPRMTAFGRIDFSRLAATRYDKLDRLLAVQGSRVLYAHPISSFFYLMLGARNPTRFEFFFPGTYNTAAQAQEVLEALRTEKVEYVLFPLPRMVRQDVVVRYVEQNYAPIDKDRQIWRRK